MKYADPIIQSILAFAAISATNHLLYGENIKTSLILSAAVILCFWMGRMSVKLIRRRKQRRLSEVIDE